MFDGQLILASLIAELKERRVFRIVLNLYRCCVAHHPGRRHHRAGTVAADLDYDACYRLTRARHALRSLARLAIRRRRWRGNAIAV